MQGVEMLREVASVDPHDYDQQQKDDAGGIRNVAAFVQELAERWRPQPLSTPLVVPDPEIERPRLPAGLDRRGER